MRRHIIYLGIIGILLTVVFGGVGIAQLQDANGPWYLVEQSDERIVFEKAAATPEPSATETPEPPTATPTEEAVEGETCPDWLHDSYSTTGPDGNSYATWHPQVGPEFGCYFRHEHGSDPALLGDGSWAPAFDYAPATVGMSEPHAGFKVHIWTDTAGEYQWAYLIHQGTAGQGRACVRFHTAGLAVTEVATGEVVADVQILGDFGEAVINRTKTKIPVSSCDHLTPLGGYEAEIENGIEVIDYSGSHGERQIGSYDAGTIRYEPWRLDTRATESVLGWHDGDLGVNAFTALTVCETSACERVVPSGGIVDGEYVYDMSQGHGAGRFVSHRADDKERLGIEDMGHGGHFCTDVFGTELVDCGEPGALHQFVAPGLSAFTTDGGKKYTSSLETFEHADADQLPFFRGQLNIDMALQAPN